ncbi:MAG: Nif3-like dinuclear metal center hexameric protein [Thermoleophilia bacterium]|nr:Nif3-like dinuclear metal center hexameric protein [Thermoleophilia bacterium]
MLVHEFLNILEKLAPAFLAERWDNVGLQAGSRASEAGSVLVTLNVTDEVLSEALESGCGIILTHHPLIFEPLASASEDGETGRLLGRAARGGIAVAAAHTNLDNAKGGLADVLAGLLDLRNVKALAGASTGWSKLVAYVPAGDLDRVKAAVFDAGAGVIGDYRHCSWSVEGQGTFLPEAGASPSIGRLGEEEKVDEFRLEMVFPAAATLKVIDALVRSHSYEEPAYDIFSMETRRRDAGAGRVGDLASETPLEEVAGLAAELFGLQEARYTGDPGRHIRRVALVPGSGAGLMNAAIAEDAEVLITGDYKYHQVLRAAEAGLSLIDVPHDASEMLALENWLLRLKRELSPYGVDAVLSQVRTDPWRRAPRRERIMLRPEEEMGMYRLHVDGGARGNPGPAAIGAVLVDPAGQKVEELADFIGTATNNVAEYQALIAGLEMSLDRGVRRLTIFSDSELIVRQIEGRYQVKNEGLRPFYQQAKSLLAKLGEFELKSVPREANAQADLLVNKALDETQA